MEEEEVNDYFSNKTYSLDSKKPGKILRKPLIFKQNLMAAAIVNNNLPDINQISGDKLKNIDLLTYSFPCQGLSIANMGRGKGIKEGEKSTSNLIWQIKRILEEALEQNIPLPKYLIMENVKNLVSKKHVADYEKWKTVLKKMGYTTKTMILNGINHRSVQRRKRLFGISVLNWKNKMKDEEFKGWFESKYSKELNIKARQNKYIRILNSSNRFACEIKDSIPNNTPSRQRMLRDNHNLLDERRNEKVKWIFNTLTTKQDRHPNIGMIANIPKTFHKKEKLQGRFITTREAYQIMGFTSKDFSNVKEKYSEGIITKESLYRQAGNSIVVTVLEDIFNLILNLEVRKWK